MCSRALGMEGCSPVKTPTVLGLRLEKPANPLSAEEVEFVKDKPYLHAIGKLTGLANGTRPDIAYAAGVLAHFNNCAGKAQWTAGKHLLCYIRAQWTTNSNMIPILILLPLPCSQVLALTASKTELQTWLTISAPCSSTEPR